MDHLGFSCDPRFQQTLLVGQTFWTIGTAKMIGDIIIEILGSIVGDGIFDALFGHRRASGSPPSEGQWNASLGSLSAFLAGVGALFSMTAILVLVWSTPTDGLAFTFGVSVVLSVCAVLLAQRALRVTRRRRRLAIAGLWTGRITIAATAIGCLVWWMR